MDIFNRDLGLDLLINKKKVSSDGGSVVSFGGEMDNSDVASIKSVNVRPNIVDVREHMQPPQRSTFENYGGEDFNQAEYESGSEVTASEVSNGVYGGGYQQQSNYPQQSSYMPQPQYRTMSDEEILNAKRELLYQFERMERKGMQLPKRFTLASSLDEMKLEYDRLKRDREIDQSIKFQRKVMMTIVTGTELLNNKFDPIGARLDGWSESINDNIDDYDDVFEELHEKYKGKTNMPPEMKLLFMLGGSAFMFHMTNTMFKTQMPGLEEVLKRNPDLMKQFAAATADTMKQNTAQTNPLFSGLSGMFSNMFGGGNGAQEPSQYQTPQQWSQPQQPSNPAPRTNMKGPTNVDDILRELERESMNDRVEMMSTVTQSELDELGDDASINGLLMNNGKKGKGISLNI